MTALEKMIKERLLHSRAKVANGSWSGMVEQQSSKLLICPVRQRKEALGRRVGDVQSRIHYLMWERCDAGNSQWNGRHHPGNQCDRKQLQIGKGLSGELKLSLELLEKHVVSF